MSQLAILAAPLLLATTGIVSAQITPGPRTEKLAIQRGEKGSIAIVKEELPANPGAASPEALSAVLGEAGYGVTLVRLGDLIDGEVLNRRNFEVLVLPNGVYYPAEGKAALVAYLQAGGSLFSTGGYAFDVPVVHSGKGWVPVDSESLPADQRKSRDTVRINTRFGKPEDTMWTEPDQIGVFDPAYPLTKVTRAEAAPDQHVFDERFRLDGVLEGFAATALTGNNHPVFPKVHARWIPLVNTYDRYGRPRGAAGALVHHYAGPFAGSSWAFFGVTNRDLFDKPPLGGAGFLGIIDGLVSKTCLHSLQTEWPCYYTGEPVIITVEAVNRGPRPCQAEVSFFAQDRRVAGAGVTLEPGQTQKVREGWTPAAGFPDDIYTLKAVLHEGERIIDETRTGFIHRRDSIVAGGPRITFEGNYFRINDRPAFLTGTNQTGMMWYCATENPLVWDHDFATMRDHGVTLLRILQFSPFASVGYEGKIGNDPSLLKTPPPERLIRQTDSIVQLAQKHGVVIFLSLHDWMGVALTEGELAAQQEWDRWWAERYKDVPGIMYDIENEPVVSVRDVPHLKKLLNEYLLAQYGTTQRLREAWRDPALKGELGEIELPEPSEAWNDVRALDVNRFKTWLLDRWVRANAAGIRGGDSDAPYTVGYLPNMPPADKILGTHHVGFSNMHWYGPLAEFPLEFKLIDRRFENKSFSLGEFGAQEAHDARVRGLAYDHDAVSVDRYLATVHYALGLGASFAADWCWKDFNDCVFPWGAIHSQDGVPKPKLKALRAMSLLFGRFEPRYEPPPLYLLAPDSHRLGAKSAQVHAAIRSSIRMLLECHVNFNVINEYDLDRLPDTAKAIVYPIPYCPSDETFDRLLRFVQAGGVLYFSGDIAYDEHRQRTRTDRFGKLSLSDPGERTALGVPTTEAKAQTSQVGSGKVVFAADPIEVRASAVDREVYRRFVDLAGTKRVGVKPDDPEVHAFSIATADGTVYVLFNTNQSQGKTVELTDAGGPVKLTLAPHKPGLAWFNGKGELLAAEASGSIRLGDAPLVEGQAQVMIAALDAKPLDASQQLLILPLEAGKLTIHSRADWTAPGVAVGEIERGQWRQLETWRPERSGGQLACEITPDRALEILVLAESDRMSEAIGQVVKRRGGGSVRKSDY